MGKINEGLFHELLTPRTTYANANFPVHFPGKLVFHHAIRTTETAEKKKKSIVNCRQQFGINQSWESSELACVDHSTISADASLFVSVSVNVSVSVHVLSTLDWYLWWVFLLWFSNLAIISDHFEIRQRFTISYATQHVMSLAVNYLMMRCAHSVMRQTCSDLSVLVRTCLPKQKKNWTITNTFLASVWMRRFFSWGSKKKYCWVKWSRSRKNKVKKKNKK